MLNSKEIKVSNLDDQVVLSLKKYNKHINNIELIKTQKDLLKFLVFLELTKGKAYPSQTTISRFINKSLRTVRYALTQLESLGFIVKESLSHLKTRIYKINFERLNFAEKTKQASFKKFAPEIATEIADKKKINNIILANAKLEILKKEKGFNGAGQGTHKNPSVENQNIIDLTQAISTDMMEKIITQVNQQTNKSFSSHYFLKSIEKIKQMDMTRGKSVIMSICLLIKRLIGWAKRELMNDKAVENQAIEGCQKPRIEPAIAQEKAEEICVTAKGNHPQKQVIMGILKQTFDRFDKTLSFTSWFKNISLEEGKGGAAFLRWPTSFDRDWVNNNFGSELRYAFKQLGVGYELVA